MARAPAVFRSRNLLDPRGPGGLPLDMSRSLQQHCSSDLGLKARLHDVVEVLHDEVTGVLPDLLQPLQQQLAAVCTALVGAHQLVDSLGGAAPALHEGLDHLHKGPSLRPPVLSWHARSCLRCQNKGADTTRQAAALLMKGPQRRGRLYRHPPMGSKAILDGTMGESGSAATAQGVYRTDDRPTHTDKRMFMG